MRQSALVIALALCGALPAATAQEPVAAPASAASSPSGLTAKVRTVSIRPSDAVYPEALHSRGVQGMVEVLAVIGPDGFPVQVAVAKTSRSKELDEAGLAVVRDLRFGAQGAASAPSARPLPPVLVPVEFLRDSVTTLSKKMCREFSVDAEYFRTTFPEQQVSDMPVVRMTIGLLVMAETQRASGEKIVSLARRSSAAGKEIAAACAAAPDSLYLPVFRELVAKGGA